MYPNFEWMSYSWLGNCPGAFVTLWCRTALTALPKVLYVVYIFLRPQRRNSRDPWCDECFSFVFHGVRPKDAESMIRGAHIPYSITLGLKQHPLEYAGCILIVVIISCCFTILVVQKKYIYIYIYIYIHMFTGQVDMCIYIYIYIYLYTCVVLRYHCCKMLQVPEINRVNVFTFLCNTIGSQNSIGPFPQLPNLSMLPVYLRAPWNNGRLMTCLPRKIYFWFDDWWMILVGFLFEDWIRHSVFDC